jgi:hypothetical protein
VCHITQDKMPYIMSGIDESYYCIPIIEDRQWNDLNNRMGMVESIVGQEGPHMVDPCSEEQMMSSNKKSNDVDLNNWLELKKQAKLHDNQVACG